jgi:hypothetical protein
MCFVNRVVRGFILQTVAVILVSLSSPVLAEIKGVAQYGANYFTAFIGFIFLIGYALHVLFKFYPEDLLKRRGIQAAAAVVLSIHIAVNFFIFSTDIFPSRMATTLLSKELDKRKIDKLSVYADHPHKDVMIKNLNPKTSGRISWNEVQTIAQVKDGLILMPPVTLDSIYHAMQSAYNLYSDDLVLNNIIEKGDLERYAVASYPTLVTSKIWGQEEEILAYRYLVLGQFSPKQKEYGKVWLLDAQKLRNDIHEFLPTQEQQALQEKHVFDIGRKTHIRVFEGYADRHEVAPPSLKKLLTRIYKAGNPTDSLVAYIFQFADVQPVWVPVGRSQPFPAAKISNNPEGYPVVFEFPEAVSLKPQPYQLRIYRTGSEDDANIT